MSAEELQELQELLGAGLVEKNIVVSGDGRIWGTGATVERSGGGE